MLLNYMLPILVGTGKMRSGGWVRDEFKRRGDERKGRLTEEVGSEGEAVGGGGTGCTYPKTPPSSLTFPFLSSLALFIAR